jgi:hypothetical protein
MLGNRAVASIIAFSAFTPAYSQISQERPELCGDKAHTFVVPANLWAEIPSANGGVALHFGPEPAVELPIGNGDLQVCPLASNKLVSFEGEGAYQIGVVDTERYVVADTFLAYDPLMSPNQRWIASRHFYAPQSEIPVSEEYLLYDLEASASQNRHHQMPSTSDAVGWSSYPAYFDNSPADLLDVPEGNEHVWRSKSFFWAADSQAIVFADSVGKRLSLVLVLIANNKPQSYTHVVSLAEVCSGIGPDEPYLILENATVGSILNGPGVQASFSDSSGDFDCQLRQLNLSLDDFQPAVVELYEHRDLGRIP